MSSSSLISFCVWIPNFGTLYIFSGISLFIAWPCQNLGTSFDALEACSIPPWLMIDEDVNSKVVNVVADVEVGDCLTSVFLQFLADRNMNYYMNTA